MVSEPKTNSLSSTPIPVSEMSTVATPVGVITASTVTVAAPPADFPQTIDNISSKPDNSIVKVKSVKVVTLDRSNFFDWRAQLSAQLRGHELMHYVEGDFSPSPKVGH